MVQKEYLPAMPDIIRITFSLPGSFWADKIYLVGDFNDWSRTATPLRLDEATWSVTLDLAIDQAYAYRYLLDHDEWLSDWNADNIFTEHDGLTTSVVTTYVSAPIPLHIGPPVYIDQEHTILSVAA